MVPTQTLAAGCFLFYNRKSEASVAATGDTVWEVVRTENHCEAPHPGTLQEKGVRGDGGPQGTRPTELTKFR